VAAVVACRHTRRIVLARALSVDALYGGVLDDICGALPSTGLVSHAQVDDLEEKEGALTLPQQAVAAHLF
jgi:hypothetical protein